MVFIVYMPATSQLYRYLGLGTVICIAELLLVHGETRGWLDDFPGFSFFNDLPLHTV